MGRKYDTPEKVYDEARWNLKVHEMFWSYFLVQLQSSWSTRVPTMAVTLAPDKINSQLLINADFLMEISDESRNENVDWYNSQKKPQFVAIPTGVIKHELSHLAFGHLQSFWSYMDKRIANIAMDLEVNCHIPRSHLPEDGCFIDGPNFKHLNLEAKKGSQYYYDKLKQAADGGDQKIQGMLDCQAPDGMGDSKYEHPTWKDIEGLSDAGKQMVERQIASQLNNAVEKIEEKSRGLLPSQVVEMIDRFKNIEPPKFNWKAYLRSFISASEVSSTKRTRRKENERFEGNPAIKVKRKKNVLVGVDTSGSVSTEELEEFFGELHHIWKAGTHITVVQCDAAISDISEFKPRMEMKVHGRGGTRFEPVLDYFMERKRKFNCLIYFTDGEAPMPEGFQGRCLWVLSNRSTPAPHLKPHCIKLKN